MLVNSLKVGLLLCSALQLSVSTSVLVSNKSGSAPQERSEIRGNLMRRGGAENENGTVISGSLSNSRAQVKAGGWTAGRHGGPDGWRIPVDGITMVQGWSSLRANFTRCRSTFQEHAPVETAVRAARTLVSALLVVNNRYGACACNRLAVGDEIVADFRARLTQFILAFGFVLKAGQEHYPDVWGTQFKAIFARSAPAFTSLRGISGSLQIDLGAVLRQVQVDPRVFLSVDLDITRLLDVNLSLGAGGLFHPSS